MNHGINISKHAPTNLKLPKPVFVSSLAIQELARFLFEIDDKLALEEAYPLMCAAVKRFMDGHYHTKSLWFKTQTRHSLPVVKVNQPGKEFVLYMQIEITEQGYCLSSCLEKPLDDNDYHAKRLIEEVMVDYHDIFTR